MSAKPDGGPAFPCPAPQGIGAAQAAGFGSELSAYPGMSLRDYFAVHAPDPPAWWYENATDFESHHKALCQWRWKYAETMLKEREE